MVHDCCLTAACTCLQILEKVEGEVQQLRVVLDGARKRGHERVWLNNQVCNLKAFNKYDTTAKRKTSTVSKARGDSSNIYWSLVA
jgi:hypothetical protein